MSFDEEDTVEEMPTAEIEDPVVAESFFEPVVEIGAITHRGRVRPHNEDQFAVVRRDRSSAVLASSIEQSAFRGGEESAWLLTVADGLGGHVSGEVASATAIRSIMNFACEMSSWIMRPGGEGQDEIDKRVTLYAQAIKRDLKAKADSDPGLSGMATTLTAAYIYGNRAMVVNVGDSRSYLLRENGIEQITRDHTVAQDLLDAGASRESIGSYRNVLTRCFGTDGEPVPVDVFHVTLAKNDRLLLCSDGLTDMVNDLAIRATVSSSECTKEACERLVKAALSAGGKDNVTVVLARMLKCPSEVKEETRLDDFMENSSHGGLSWG